MGPALVLTLFSTKGPIPARAWDEKTNSILPLLAAQLPCIKNAPSKPSMRFLDTAASATYPAHRVADVLIPLRLLSTRDSTSAPSSSSSSAEAAAPIQESAAPSSASVPSQSACTAAVRSVSSTTTSASLLITLQPLNPIHKLFSSSSSSSDQASQPLQKQKQHQHQQQQRQNQQLPPRLALFDIDSTLIRQEVIDELARANGTYERVAAITESAMRGDPPYSNDFTASLRDRVALLRGLDNASVWDRLTGCSNNDGDVNDNVTGGGRGSVQDGAEDETNTAPNNGTTTTLMTTNTTITTPTATTTTTTTTTTPPTALTTTATIDLTPGADTLTRCLRADGWTLGAASGGFLPLARWVGRELELDFVEANALAVDGQGKLTGQLEAGVRVVDGARKREVLLERADAAAAAAAAPPPPPPPPPPPLPPHLPSGSHGGDAPPVPARHDNHTSRSTGTAPKTFTLAVGDGNNDLPMLAAADLGVAFNAKPKVQALAPAVINGESLLDVLFLLGWTELEIKAVVRGGLAS